MTKDYTPDATEKTLATEGIEGDAVALYVLADKLDERGHGIDAAAIREALAAGDLGTAGFLAMPWSI